MTFAMTLNEMEKMQDRFKELRLENETLRTQLNEALHQVEVLSWENGRLEVLYKADSDAKGYYCYCADCDYTTESRLYSALILKLSNEGGYIISDKAGGYYGKCPKCDGDNLAFE